MNIKQWILCIILYLQLFQYPLIATELIPIEHFFQLPEYDSVQISPNGKYLAVIAPVNDRKNLVLIETANLSKARAITQYRDFDIGAYFWASNDNITFAMDISGVRNEFSVYKVNTTGTPKVTELVGTIFGNSGLRSASLFNALPNDPDHVLVSFNKRRISSPDLYKLPLDSRWSNKRKKNSKMKIIARNPGNVIGWAGDRHGFIRGAISQNGLEYKSYVKKPDDTDFEEVSSFNRLDEYWYFDNFGFDNKKAYIRSSVGRDLFAFYEYDLETKTIGRMIFGHDSVDAESILISNKKNKILGISYYDDFLQYVWLDEDEERLRTSLQNNFIGMDISKVSSSKDENLEVILVEGGSDPGTYYLLNRQSNKMIYLFSKNSKLKSEELSKVKPFQFESSDGLTIHGYITIPKNSSGRNMPTIIRPHIYGERLKWRFNETDQFLANRGYAIVRINSRGLKGYGIKFENANVGELGGKIHQDYIDAIHYLSEKKIIDSDSVCIFGFHWGGYSAISNLITDPDLFKCGISYNSVTDVGKLISKYPKRSKNYLESVKLMYLGQEKSDNLEILHRLNLSNFADKIKTPLMIIHGSKSTYGQNEMAHDLKNALKANGKTLADDEWVVMNDERGWEFRKVTNKIALFNKIEKFLAKHLNK